jgi:hypothetical protein
MAESRYDDRRRYQRILTRIPAKLVQYDPRGQVVFQTQGEVLNLSAGGLFVMIPHAVVPKLPMWISLRLGEWPIHIKANQIRANSLSDGLHSVSVEFDISCIEAILKIERYVNETQPQAG